MALLFCDGADYYTSNAAAMAKWTAGTSNAGGGMIRGEAGNGRFGSNAVAFNGGSSGGTASKTVAGAQTMIVGFAVNRSFASQNLCRLTDGSVTHINLTTDSSARPMLLRGQGGTLIGTVAVDSLPPGWHYFEIRVKVDDTVGEIELRVDGVTAIGPLTGVDTRNGGTAQITTLAFDVGTSPFNSYYFDDVYICDTTGSIANDFLGDVRVQAIMPNGNGNSSQLLGSDSNTTDNYLLVDDPNAPDDDTTYVESSTVGEKDTYAYGNITAITGTIHAVQPIVWARKTDAGARTVKTIARLGGVEEDGPAKTLGLTYGQVYDIRHTKPGGGQWTIADVNSAEFGVKVNT